MDSCTDATISLCPSPLTRRSRNSITSGKLWPVSTCITGNGSGSGRNAFSANRSRTMESLPAENSRTGRSSSATTSRMMCTASASSSRSSSTRLGSTSGGHVGSPLLLGVCAVAVHPFVGALIGLALQHRPRRQLGVEPQRLEDGADHLGQVAPQHRIRHLERLDFFLGEPVLPALFLFAQHRDDVCDGAGVVGGACVAERIRPAAPYPRLHCPPERHRLRHHVRPVDVNEQRFLAHDVTNRGQQALAGAIRQLTGPLQQQRCLIPHQLAAPHAVGCPSDGADVVAPDFGRRQVRLARVQRIEQAAVSTRRRHRRTTRAVAGPGWWSADTERTLAVRLRRPLLAAIRRAGCCRFAAKPARDKPSGGLSPNAA